MFGQTKARLVDLELVKTRVFTQERASQGPHDLLVVVRSEQVRDYLSRLIKPTVPIECGQEVGGCPAAACGAGSRLLRDIEEALQVHGHRAVKNAPSDQG